MASPPPSPSPQVVGHAFVQQYYNILHQSPELVYRFYQESSKLGRPDEHGEMSSITTTEAINEKILSMDFLKAEIKTIDAQESLDGGVTVLVTGHITGKDNAVRDFTQSFFLAPQDRGYFVLNDIFRYVREDVQDNNQQGSEGLVNDPVSVPQQEQHAVVRDMSSWEPEDANEEEVYNPSDNDDESVVEDEAAVVEVVNKATDISQAIVADSSDSAVHEEAPKKSYASIVKVMKDNAAPVSAPTHPARPAQPKPERQAPAPVAEIPASSTSHAESSNVQEPEGDGHSIYVKSLPLSATPAELEEEFKKFGTIKPGGIQVRSNRVQGFCFGFVEFEEASAVQSAIEASPIMIGGRQALVEEKRATGSRASNRGRFAPGRGGGGFWSEAGRGRGNYGGGRGYGRVGFNNRAGRGSDVGYQRVDHAGSSSGRGNRPGLSASSAASSK
uniref:G3BP-like protein n=1 Tax=Ananas comosus var. bracteatus TaxID=296719 RepID=A0A6V7Q0R4_ANACO|nr:unnamed protein product [Ananas comosus var. bracteatus]